MGEGIIYDCRRVGWPNILAAAAGFLGSLSLVILTWLGNSSRIIPNPWVSRQWLIDARERFGPMVDSPVWMLMILALLFGSWVALSRNSVSPWTRRAAAVLWIFPLLWALPWGSGDVYNYVEQGWALAHGYHPSIVPAGTAPSPYTEWLGAWKGTTVAYPALALVMSAISTKLGSGSELDAIQMQRIWPALAVVILWWALGVLADRLRISRSFARWVGLMNPIVLLHGIAGGHHDMMAIALVIAGSAAWFRLSDRAIWIRLLVTGAFAVLGGLVKPTVLLGVVIIPLFTKAPSSRAWLARLSVAAGMVLVSLGATLLVSGLLPGGWAWLQANGVPGEGSRTLLRDLQWMANHDRFISAGDNPLKNWFLANVDWLVIASPLAVAALLLIRRPRGGAAEVLARMWFAILVFGPTGWPWYTLAFIPLIGLITRTRRAILGIVAVVTVWTIPVGVAPSVADLPTFLLYWLPTVVVAWLAALGIPQSPSN